MRIKILKRTVALTLLLVPVAGTLLYIRPLPSIRPVVDSYTPALSAAPQLPWPAYGQAAVGARGFGVLDSRGAQTAAPTASIAKVITALAVLDKQPITPGQPGSIITLGTNDVRIYNDYIAKNGSVAQIADGEKITQYQALQALLLPSANNIADSLAIWAFGSMDAYVSYANQMVKNMGLSATHVADASGFSPQTVSNSRELVMIGQAAMSNPVLAEIVKQTEAVIPVAGTIRNVNWLLGTEGVIGIKTGDTDEAGGCFLFAAEREISGQKIILVGAVMGAPTRNTAITDSRSMIAAAASGFEQKTLVKAGTSVGKYTAPWNQSTQAVTAKDLSAVVWKGSKTRIDIALNDLIPPQNKVATVGSVSLNAGQKTASVPVTLKQNLPGASPWWRIFR